MFKKIIGWLNNDATANNTAPTIQEAPRPTASVPPPAAAPVIAKTDEISVAAKAITVGLLREMFPTLKNPEEFVPALRRAVMRFDINTPLRLAAFLAQTGHESGGYTVLVENLNYSAEGLMRTFPRYFPTRESTEGYARNPEKIANRVYGGRMGNGDEASGDGYRYRGKGLIQITGKANTTHFAQAMKMSLQEAVSFMLTVEGACMSAAWFWANSGCNVLADGGDANFESLTRRINGGLNGLDDRRARYALAKKLLKV